MVKPCSSGKQSFATPQAAWAHRQHVEGKPMRKRRKKASGAHGTPGAYKCTECKAYHVSSYTT